MTRLGGELCELWMGALGVCQPALARDTGRAAMRYAFRYERLREAFLLKELLGWSCVSTVDSLERKPIASTACLKTLRALPRHKGLP